MNAIGALYCKADGTEPGLYLHLQSETVDTNSIIEFLDRLTKVIPGKIALLWDGLRAHTSKKTKEHIAKQSQLTVYRLPSYAPELNPVEYLWATIKYKDLANYGPTRIEELESQVIKAKARIEEDNSILLGLLKASGLYN